MGGTGGFTIDIILFAMIAGFLILRLRAILGRRTGYERPAQPVQAREAQTQPRPAAQAPTTPATIHAVPDPASPVGRTLARMVSADPKFDPTAFLDGAEKAFQIIVRAFAAGDRAALKPLLGEDTWNAFDRAIAARENDGLKQVTDVKAVHGLVIDSAELNGTVATITTRITSDQVNMTRTESGQTVTGTDAVTEIHDIWTFERDLSRADPVWHLVAARSA